jgi:hypothetical protein
MSVTLDTTLSRRYYGGRFANHFAAVYSSLLISAKLIPKKMIPESNISGKRPVRKPRERCVSAVEIGNREDLEMRKLGQRISR